MLVHLIVEAAHASSGCDDVGVAVVMVYVGVRHHLHFCKKKKVLIRLIDQWLAVKNGFAIGLILKTPYRVGFVVFKTPCFKAVCSLFLSTIFSCSASSLAASFSQTSSKYSGVFTFLILFFLGKSKEESFFSHGFPRIWTTIWIIFC